MKGRGNLMWNRSFMVNVEKKKKPREKGGRFMSVHMEFRVVFPEFFQLSGLFSKAFYMVVIELIKLSLLLFCTRTMRGFYCFFS